MKRYNRLRVEALDDRCLPSFGAAANYDVGLNPQAVVAADFNNDGLLDLATGNVNVENVPSGNTVSVLLGNADGTFQQAKTSETGYYSTHSIAVGDFNEDGNLDLAAAGSDDPIVLIGTGDGTFQPPVRFDLGLHEGTMSVAIGDFDADGKMDLAVASGYDLYDYGTLTILRGDGGGGFAASAYVSLGGYSNVKLAVADLNGDEKPDVVAAQEDRGLVTVLLSNGDGTVRRAGDFATSPYPRAVAVGDFTSDHVPDLVTVGHYVEVLPGRGDGTFGGPIRYSGVSGQWAVAVADFNRDGRLDVATADYYYGNGNVLRGRGDGTFDTPEHFAVGAGPYAVTAGDFGNFGGDGWPDVATANPSADTVSVLLSDQSWSGVVPTVSINDATVTEGNTGTVNATFTVTLSAPSSQSVTVNYSTANGTATAGSDFQTASGTLTFAPGVTSKTITVAVLGDPMFEPNETFAVNLSGSTNATIGDGNGSGTIVNDDAYVAPGIRISDFSKAEGRNGSTTFTFTVTLSAPSAIPVTVNYATADGTARAGEDYEAATGTLTFAPGETTKTVTIKVKGDRKVEADETFFVNLSGASSAVILDAQGLGTILNDD